MTKAMDSTSPANSSNVLVMPDSVVTVLTSADLPGQFARMWNMHKRFYLDKEDVLKVVPYPKAKLFNSIAVPVNGISDLGRMITRISTDPKRIVIRGLHQRSQVSMTQRLKDIFPEHPQGTPWVMIDFDDIELPEGVEPLSLDAIEHCIAKLPPEFQGVTYFYQHSNSAGILNPDGTPRKAGLNAHLFFWLSRRVTGGVMAAHLQSHCIQTDFYEVGFDKGGDVRVKYGIDPSVIKGSVQPHYTAAPEIGPGVQCQLDPSQRQGFVKKELAEVEIPALPANLVSDMSRRQTSITDDFKRRNGRKSVISQTRTGMGISTVQHWVNPDSNLRGGRTFVKGKLTPDGKFFTLFFADENSPGSYYVVKDRPEFAYRHGGDRILLKDLSAGAHAHVRDVLQWFTEIPHHDLQLDEHGYLPPIAGFAQAKVSLILAPTGSGKTKAAIDWMRAKIASNALIVYAAPTIALVNQMRSDLTLAGVSSHLYTDTWISSLPSFGVIVTTNHSMRRILGLIYDAYIPHNLIVDEIHMGLDEFMKKKLENEAFESAIAKATQTLLLTGTLTKVQRTKIVSTVGHALGGLTEARYCCYEFPSVKRNPLIIRRSANFDSDFIVLMEELAAKAKAEEPLRRVVVLLDTSKMRKYQTLLDQYGLTQYAHVVSRPENSPEDIELARVSQLPILIASPLFALGLNFDAEPELLLVKFDYVKADTNQVNQTINRANRPLPCEVRIYGNPNRGAKIQIPDSKKVADEVRALLKVEATLEGLLEEHFHIDRVTYGILRQVEKNSQAALGELVENDNFQNYRVMTESSVPQNQKDKAEVFKAHGKAARLSYLSAISEQARRFTSAELDMLFANLEQLSAERRNSWLRNQPRTDLEISEEEGGLLMTICNLSDASQVKPVSGTKLKRLFGEIGPWRSAQYSRTTTPDWAKVESEKTDKLVILVNKLGAVQAGSLSPVNLLASVTRNKQLREGFLALAKDDIEYVSMNQQFTALIKARERVRAAGSDADKAKVLMAGLNLLADILEPLGVLFARKKIGRRVVIDYDTLVVPATWDLTLMEAKLERQAQRLKSLPAEQKIPMADGDQFDGEPLMSLKVCKRCAFLSQYSCALGHPVAWQGDEFELTIANSCASFRPLKGRLANQ
ncbi:DEAD/DEAH box helicase [Polaromonas sp.]|uniref:DEAD/DEAH box helicase n=1 Tax=Polaromonas sp. TaxID=1869339 RepID=UPI003BA8A328